MIREKVLQLTREEIPHSVAVVIDEMKRDEDTDKIHIRATIMVERDSQKGIVIGKQGSMLKKIGTLARKDIEVMLGTRSSLKPGLRLRKIGVIKNLIWPILVTMKKNIKKLGTCSAFLLEGGADA